MNNKKKVLIIVPSVLVALIVVVYVVGVIFFSNHFLPNTKINGTTYGWKAVDYVAQDMEIPSQMVMTLVGKNYTEETIDLSSIEYRQTVDSADLEEILKSQNSFLWPFRSPKIKEYQVESHVAYNKDKLHTVINDLFLVSRKDVVEPENAYINMESSTYEIVPEVIGDKVDVKQLELQLIDGLNIRKEQINLEEENCYLLPEIREDSPVLQKTIEQLKQLQTVEIIYDFETKQEVLDHSIFNDWISLDKKSNIKINRKKAESYVNNLSATYDTLRTNRIFQSTKHGDITVGGGIYGWQTDIPQTTDMLIEYLLEGKSQTVIPVYTTVAKGRGENDIGSTYIEIDLTEQHMWYYIDGELYTDTPIVSGLPTEERETPTGVFCIWAKETERFLEGDDYKLWVDYWLPIDWTGVGIHDAVWQSTFGKKVYHVKGSHGCINTPKDICKKIFDRVETGTPVVVYKS